MSSNRVEQVFSATAQTYDSARARLIPCFAELYANATGLLAAETNYVLDLGAGTGLLAGFVRERFPDASIEMIDNSEPMLAQARQRFGQDQMTTFRSGDYTSCRWGSGYDAILSALSIHHLGDDAKQALLARVFTALRPGGLFINAEQILQPTPTLEAQAMDAWLKQVRTLGATEQQIGDSLLRQTEDRCATIEDQLSWMRQADFADVRCAFQSGRFAVLTGQKPRSSERT